ncbi:MAG TPA: zinc-ribbon domain-containing protein [Polyangiaceae bacterium]|nr:zinc-ribbon domain-containing protein [Polyangiaceae bacterium]
MDVRCSRCGTEYDFDDALVSERGTTVKCTNCGHQFKVYPGGGGGAPERWIVRKSSGRELVYTSLRDLQRAIAQRQVGPSDLLSRGGGHPLRALGAIAELEPFFHAQGPAIASGNEAAQRTLLGTGDRAPEPRFPAHAPEEPMGTQPAGFAPRRNSPLAPPKSSPVATGSDPFAAQDQEPVTAPRNIPPVVRTTPAGSFDAPSPAYDDATVPYDQAAPGYVEDPGYAPTEPGQVEAPPAPQSGPLEDGITSTFRQYQDSYSDESISRGVVPQRPALKWVVGVVVVGALAFIVGTVGMKYARKLSSAPAPSAQAADPRVAKLVEDAEGMLQKGDFDGAKEQIDKASVLSEKDPTVLTLAARIEAWRADTHWLALKLIDPSQKAELDVERAELAQRLPRVQKTADAAAAVAGMDPSVVRARIDALRLAGDVTKARELVGALGSDTAQPETAYVLAALDLAEASPAWPTVIDKLRTAAAAERGVGRARPALVYALASSGSIDDANSELAKIDASGAQSGLVARLKAFVERKGATAPSASASAAPQAALASAPQPRGAAEPAETVPRGADFRRLLEDAAAAKRSGDLGRAEALYNAAKDQQPGNVEALAGLGDVARLRGDSATATAYYDNVLRQNPTYLPALTASADLKWAAGDRVSALFLYKRIVNLTDPGTPYGQRAATRIAEAQAAASPPSGESTATPSPAPQEKSETRPTEQPAGKPSPPSDTPSNIDTTDLPGFK